MKFPLISVSVVICLVVCLCCRDFCRSLQKGEWKQSTACWYLAREVLLEIDTFCEEQRLQFILTKSRSDYWKRTGCVNKNTYIHKHLPIYTEIN